MTYMDIGFLLNKATRQFRLRLADALGGSGLTPQQAAALMAIASSAEGRLTPRVIAEAIDTDQATISGLLERLARDGWVRAEPNPQDGRSRLIALTEKAEVALPKVRATAESVSLEEVACLSAQEVDTLRELLGRLSATERPVAAERKAGSR